MATILKSNYGAVNADVMIRDVAAKLMTGTLDSIFNTLTMQVIFTPLSTIMVMRPCTSPTAALTRMVHTPLPTTALGSRLIFLLSGANLARDAC